MCDLMIVSLKEFVNSQVGMLRQFEQQYHEKGEKQRLYLWLEDYNAWVNINLRGEKDKAEKKWITNAIKRGEETDE